MMFSNYDSLLSISTDRSEWKVCVRAQTIWKGINFKTNEFRGFNIIFIDDQNCRIHAFISAKLCDVFAKQLQEGQLYSLSNFKVSVYGGDETNRALRNDKHIYFELGTKFEPLTENICKIQKYAFDLFGLEEVDKFVTDNRFLIDVIGVVDTVKPTCVFSKDNPKKSHIKFWMTDARNRVGVTFFNEFGESFEKAFNEIVEGQVVIIICCAKVNKYDGQVGLTNYPATRFYLNPLHYSVKDMLKSLSVMDLVEEIDNKIFTIEEIKNLSEQFVERNVLCQVFVKKVEEKNNWYDNICSGCDEEVDIVDGRYRCLKEKRNVPYPEKRFRLCTVCCDKTGILPIVFSDEEVQRITGKSVFEIENDESQVGEGISFPPLLKKFESFEYIITLSPTIENIKKSCSVYKAKKITPMIETTADNTDAAPLSPGMPEMSMNAESNLSEIPTVRSPPTEKSTNRSKSRKTKVEVKSEMDENTPIAKLMKT